MSVQDIAAVAQSGAIAIAFLYLVWKVPGLFHEWLAANERQSQYRVQEHEKDRTARHERAAVFIKTFMDLTVMHDRAISNITQAIADLRVVVERTCKYPGEGRHEQD